MKIYVHVYDISSDFRSESTPSTRAQLSPPKLKPLSQSTHHAADRQVSQLPQHQYENSSAEMPSVTRPIGSQYIQMGSTDSLGTPSPQYLPNSTPPPSFMEAIQHPAEPENRGTSSTLDRNRNIPLGSHARKMVDFQRQHSRSMDDITDHSKLRVPYVYNNNSYEAGEVSPLQNHTVGFTYMNTEKSESAPRRYKDTEKESRYIRESQAPGAGLEFTQGASGDDYAVPYTQVRPSFNKSRLRKSVSNPELLESALNYHDRTVDGNTQKTFNVNRPPRPNLPLNWKFLQNSPVAQRKTSDISPTSTQMNNFNSNPETFSQKQSQAVRVMSPSIDSIQPSGKTKIFKRQFSQDSSGMTSYTSDVSNRRNAAPVETYTQHTDSTTLPPPNKDGIATSETPC